MAVTARPGGMGGGTVGTLCRAAMAALAVVGAPVAQGAAAAIPPLLRCALAQKATLST